MSPFGFEKKPEDYDVYTCREMNRKHEIPANKRTDKLVALHNA